MPRRAPAPRAALASAAICLATVACSGGSGPAASPTARPAASPATSAAASWPTYHGDNARHGAAAGPVLRAPLGRAWSVELDAATYAQPVVGQGRAYVATENNTVYAVDITTGKVKWRRHLAAPMHLSQLPCGNIDPSGITGTPVYDAARRALVVATESAGARHTLFALDAATGAVRWRRSLDVIRHRDRYAEQQRGALLLTSGHVYVPFGGRYGDCGNYVGYVVAVPAAGAGPLATYVVPTAREAGMWAAPVRSWDRLATSTSPVATVRRSMATSTTVTASSG